MSLRRSAFSAAILVLVYTVVFQSQVLAAGQLSGRGEWRSHFGDDFIRGRWTIQLQRYGTKLEGTMHLTGSNVLKSGTVHGSIDGQNVVLGLASDGVTAATFSGALNGNAIAGEWRCPRVSDEGSWYGTLDSVEFERPQH